MNEQTAEGLKLRKRRRVHGIEIGEKCSARNGKFYEYLRGTNRQKIQ